MRDLNPNDPHDVPPFSLEDAGCGCDFSPDSEELAFTENLDPVPAVSTNADIFTLDLTDPNAKPVKVSTSPGGDFNPAYSPDGKYLAWRSQARNGYESDKFRLWLYDRATKTGKDLLPSFDLWVDEFAWAGDSKSIYFVSDSQGEAPIFQMAQDQKGQSVARLGFSDRGVFSNLQVLPDAKTIVASRTTVQSPAEVFAIENDQTEFVNRTWDSGEGIRKGFWPLLKAKESQLTHLNNGVLASLDLPDFESFFFLTKDQTHSKGF